ncbi:MAG: hypothetical protein ACI92O_003893 [Colwellia sp.]
MLLEIYLDNGVKLKKIKIKVNESLINIARDMLKHRRGMGVEPKNSKKYVILNL